MDKKRSILVVFGNESPKLTDQYDEILDAKKLNELIEPGSIYEASALAEELSRIKLLDGTRITKFITYKGYELWWIYYSSIYLYFCLPYTQYKRLLEYLKAFNTVYFYKAPYKSLFAYYFKAHGIKAIMLRESGFKSSSFLPFGVLIQILITFLSLPVLIMRKCSTMIFVGDKFEFGQDYDFRMKFIYKELRHRNLQFVEFIRSLESWKKVLQNAFTRKRPVIYSEAITFVGKLCGFLSGGHRRGEEMFSDRVFTSGQDPETRFKFLVATNYIRGVYGDIWAIRIMKTILNIIGVKSAYITAAMERNFHTYFGCKFNQISTIGILHGVASRYYNVYDFLPSFDGAKKMSVDKYGLWSEWWKEYYIKNSKVYRPEQLYVSGLMRPLESKERLNLNTDSEGPTLRSNPIKVLLVPGELSNPKEIMPYLLGLMEDKDISLHLTFRPYRDAFENWIKSNNPETLDKIGKEKILLGNIHDAISQCDIVVGSYSTGALEALLQLKPLVFFNTSKWGDYFDLREYNNGCFFAENIKELNVKIKGAINTPVDTIKDLQKQYFGDPYENGSRWVVDQLEEALKGCVTK